MTIGGTICSISLTNHNACFIFVSHLPDIYIYIYIYILLTNATAAQNVVALSYDRVRGLYILAVVFAATIVI